MTCETQHYNELLYHSHIKGNFYTNLIGVEVTHLCLQKGTIGTVILISQKKFNFWIPYLFLTNEFCVELPLWNVINNSPRCVEYVLLKSVLLLILWVNCCGTHKNKKTWWVSKESYYFSDNVNARINKFIQSYWSAKKSLIFEYHIDF